MWTDVAARPNGELVTVNGDGQWVMFSTDAVVACPAGHLRCAALDTRVAVAGQGSDSTDVIVATDTGALVRLPGPAHGVQPVQIRDVAGDHFSVCYVSNGGMAVTFYELDADLRIAAGPTSLPVPSPILGTSQGLLDAHPLVWTDLLRVVEIGGVKYGLSMTRLPYTVGQDYIGQMGGGIIAYHHITKQHLIVWRGDAHLPPRLAVRPDGTAICAITAGAGVFVESAQWLPASQAPPPFIAPPQPVPTPQPVPAPQPIPVPQPVPEVPMPFDKETFVNDTYTAASEILPHLKDHPDDWKNAIRAEAGRVLDAGKVPSHHGCFYGAQMSRPNPATKDGIDTQIMDRLTPALVKLR